MEEYKKVTISFTKEQLEKLDEIMSREQGYTRSSLVREAVDYYLAQNGSVSYLSPIISQNIRNISGYLCEQRDSRPVSPCVALCAICCKKTRKVTRQNRSRGDGRLL